MYNYYLFHHQQIRLVRARRLHNVLPKLYQFYISDHVFLKRYGLQACKLSRAKQL